MATPAPGRDRRRSRLHGVALEADLGWALGSVFRAYLKSAHASVADLPGGPRGYQLLTAAGSEAALSQQALGQRVGVDRSVMTYLVDDLVDGRPGRAPARSRRPPRAPRSS